MKYQIWDLIFVCLFTLPLQSSPHFNAASGYVSSARPELAARRSRKRWLAVSDAAGA